MKVLFILLACLSGGVSAQTVAPFVMFEPLERGQAGAVLDIGNPGTEPLRLRVSAASFTYEDGGLVVVEPGGAHDLTPYLQYAPLELTVAPGATRQVRLAARIPPSQVKGELRAVIFVQPVNSAMNRGIGVASRIGATFYAQPSDSAPELRALSARWRKDVGLLLGVRNAGTASAQAGVRWQLRRAGAVVASGESLPYTVVALSERALPLGETGLRPGEYTLELTLETYQGLERLDRSEASLSFTIPAD